MLLRLIPVCLVLAACGATPARPRRIAAETTVALASGATLEVPAGWWVTVDATTIVLEDPERELRVTLIERAAAELPPAIAAAWQRALPGVAVAPSGPADAPPATDGWDAVLEQAYIAPEGRVRRAVARRLGGRSYVAVIDGDSAAADRRDAQLGAALDSLHPPGLAPESFAGQTPRALDPDRLDAFIAGARAQLAVPGAAVAVLRDGRVIYERILGVRALGEPAAVTADTRFLIASVTKPMTTLMEAALVDAGRFTWDTPVTEVLPAFALADADTTRALRMWHMSCACTGMPRQDLEDIFEYDGISAEARLASMRTMAPTTALGETFQYSNLMVSAGGFAAAHAYAPERGLADAYAAAMAATVFEPIGMTATTLDDTVVIAGDHASPHALAIDGEVRRMPVEIERAVRPILPAGGVWTTLRDLERYLATELAGGVAPDGTRVVSAAAMQARRTVRVRSGDGDGYALGLGVGRYHGLATFGHDGGAFGFGTTLFALPEHGIGIVILTNIRNGGPAEQLPFNAAVTRAIVEQLFVAKDLAATQLAYYVETTRRTAAHAAATVERAPDPAWLARLAGTYTEPALGTVTVTGATFDAGEWRSQVGRRVDPDGREHLVLLDPPFAGGAVDVVGDTLVVPGQTTYTFVRTRGPTPAAASARP
jgi:CubicO group peptidase (beta-lactamase class C family)